MRSLKEIEVNSYYGAKFSLPCIIDAIFPLYWISPQHWWYPPQHWWKVDIEISYKIKKTLMITMPLEKDLNEHEMRSLKDI